MGFDEEDYIALSALQHYLFCPRQCGLIHLEQTWQESRLTAEGRLLHERVHEAGSDWRDGVLTIRGLRLSSAFHGLSGSADSVEFHPLPAATDASSVHLPTMTGRWTVFPVEFKRGKQKPDDSDSVQLCAQALCLEEMLNTDIASGALYYGASRRRTVVAFSPRLRERTEETIRLVRTLLSGHKLPKASLSEKCKSCSLAESCLPELSELRSAADYLRKSVNDALEGADETAR